jgi:sugar/nucleoside kinase (ribokinase family)
LGAALKAEGIAPDCVQWLDAPTTLSLIGVDASGVPSYSFYGAGCADRQVPMSALDTLPAATQAIHIGSYAMVVEPVASVQRALVERIARSLRVCMRTSNAEMPKPPSKSSAECVVYAIRPMRSETPKSDCIFSPGI